MFTTRAFARLFSIATVAATIAFPLTAAHAQTTNLGAANDFNVFVFGNHTQSGTDTEGRVAVGGNANYDNGSAGMTIASKRGGSTTDNLIVGGNYTNRYNSVNGNTVVSGNTTWLGPTQKGNLASNGAINFTGNGSVTGSVTYGTSISDPSNIASKATQGTTTLPINFSAAQTSLTSLSDSLAAYSSNGVTSVAYGGITMTGTDSTLNVFTLNSSQLTGATGLNINATAGSTVIVNVIGSAATFTNFGMNISGADKQNVLFNFNTASQINLTNFAFNGSILATKADVSTTYGQLNGTIIANSLSGSMESHDYTFKGNLNNPNGTTNGTAVPEASSAALLLVTLFFVGVVPTVGIVASRREK